MNEALRIILPAYLAVFFFVVLLGRSYLVWKRTGVNPYVVSKSGRPIDFVEACYRVPVALILITTLAYVFLPGVYRFAVPITWLETDVVRYAGLFLMLSALVWIATAQAQMGASWRIGIDPKHETELVERGLFKVSRNPIFVGMRLALWGIFLATPNAVMLTAVALTDVLMQTQVRLEEEFLLRTHGADYDSYRRRVRRWI